MLRTAETEAGCRGCRRRPTFLQVGVVVSPGAILLIPPAPALLDEFLIEIHSIWQEHIGNGAPVILSWAVGPTVISLPKASVSDSSAWPCGRMLDLSQDSRCR